MPSWKGWSIIITIKVPLSSFISTILTTIITRITQACLYKGTFKRFPSHPTKRISRIHDDPWASYNGGECHHRKEQNCDREHALIDLTHSLTEVSQVGYPFSPLQFVPGWSMENPMNFRFKWMIWGYPRFRNPCAEICWNPLCFPKTYGERGVKSCGDCGGIFNFSDIGRVTSVDAFVTRLQAAKVVRLRMKSKEPKTRGEWWWMLV